MLKSKKMLLIILVTILLILIPNMVNAKEVFTTSDGIVVTKKSGDPGDGVIKLKITNIELSEGIEYEWGISATNIVDNVSKWESLNNYDATNKTADINLVPSVSYIKEILANTERLYLWVKDKTNDQYIIDALKIDDLTFPPLKAFKTELQEDSSYRFLKILTPYVGEVKYSISYRFVKITDQKIIDEYNNVIADGGSLSQISSLANISEADKIDDWKIVEEDFDTSGAFIKRANVPTSEGLYYIWIKATSTNRTIIGYTLWNGDKTGPRVNKIEVDSPVSGTYKTPQTVKIRAYFNEKITGTTVPTLKIRFGESPERELTNGTIKNDYIEYSYNIQDTDIGQLANVSFAGGTIKDASGNAATITCPTISGSTIKANVDGNITNSTENQDKENNNAGDKTQEPETTPEVKPEIKPETTPEVKPETKPEETKKPATTNKNDATKAPGTIPYTGGEFILIVSILAIVGIGIYTFKKNKDLKDI